MSNNCRICDKPIMFGGRKYCGDPCREVAKQTSQRVIKQAKKLKIIKEGKECNRCKVLVHEPSMKKYCKSCSEILKTNHYSSYERKPKKVYICKACDKPRLRTKTYCDDCKPKKERIMKPKPCHRCDENIENAKGNRKFCDACIKLIAKEKVDKQASDRKKTRGQQKQADPLPSWMLERGNITDTGRGTCFG